MVQNHWDHLVQLFFLVKYYNTQLSFKFFRSHMKSEMSMVTTYVIDSINHCMIHALNDNFYLF